MQNILRKLTQIAFLILGLTTLSHTTDQNSSDEYCEISLNTYGRIAEQQEFLKPIIKIPRLEITPEEVIYDSPKQLKPGENIYGVSEVKNPCAFLLGRCHFCYYRGEHPNHDCCDFGCSENVGPIYWMCMLTSIIASGMVGITCCNWIPLAKVVSVWCCPVTHWGTAIINVIYANRIAGQDYGESYHRGLLCLPDDLCSCTSCTGINYLDQRKSCLSMTKRSILFCGGILGDCLGFWIKLC